MTTYWQDEGYLLSKNNFDENSLIIESFTLEHGKCAGIVYGGSSKKQKKNLQIGNKISLNWKAKGENRIGYFSTELIKPISPPFFDDKERAICILSACSILKILLPERQINKKIYLSFENFLISLFYDNWINLYIEWELSLVKELGYESENKNALKNNVKDALIFNKKLLIENFILPNKLRMPVSRIILEKYIVSNK